MENMGLQIEKVKKTSPEGETAFKNLAMLNDDDIIMSTSHGQQEEARRFRIDSASENPTCACFSQ
jgi:hypothetical protein